MHEKLGCKHHAGLPLGYLQGLLLHSCRKGGPLRFSPGQWGPPHRHSPHSCVSKVGIVALFVRCMREGIFNSLLSLMCSGMKSCG